MNDNPLLLRNLKSVFLNFEHEHLSGLGIDTVFGVCVMTNGTGLRLLISKLGTAAATTAAAVGPLPSHTPYCIQTRCES